MVAQNQGERTACMAITGGTTPAAALYKSKIRTQSVVATETAMNCKPIATGHHNSFVSAQGPNFYVKK